jgi:predicted CoA-binding protein
LAGQQILGQTVAPTLDAIETQIDMVDVFRHSDAALGIVRDCVRLKDKLGLKVVWMQLSVRNDDAARLAEAAGLKVVMNRCPKIEYGRLSGEIGWTGVNAGVISSKRPQLGAIGVQNHVLGIKR